MTDTQTTETGLPARWGMVIDLNRCVGCQTCTIACKHTNDTPPGVQWRRVLDVEHGTFPDVQREFMVVGCQHCAEPPCVPVCPTGATRQREDGLVTIDYDVCIGCSYCAVACPYQARTVVHEPLSYFGPGGTTIQEAATAHPDRIGVAQKCTFCQHRVDDGLAAGLTPGVDPDATPACAASCITQAIQFGDYNDPSSNVSQLVADNPSFQMHAELGTDPQIKYLYTTPAVPGRAATEAPDDEDRLRDLANPLTGQHQTLWDWRAAMNWCFGGIGGGLGLFAWIGTLTGAVSADGARIALFLAAASLALGLFFVFLKIGRKLRFWRAALRPQTSWMTRELYVAVVFFPAVLASLIFPNPAFFAIAGIGAAGFLASQAKILHLARGIPAWRAPLVPWMIIATGLLEGLGALTMLAALFGNDVTVTRAFAWCGIAAALLTAALWVGYRKTAKAAGIGPLARDQMAKMALPMHAIGHAVPAIIWAHGLLYVDPAVVTAIGGLAAIGGGVYWKYMMLCRLGYTQGYALANLPQRGSGNRAAPSRMEGTSIRPA